MLKKQKNKLQIWS